ncbi:class I SAM-dependent methyltransferase [Actinomadura sp. GTD37]|uniref:class I SAM-dependent methyltransferase n=1 Tax=Actinomadura sp. GTD37 TaxID=1778030 RepID=UPI0035C2514B
MPPAKKPRGEVTRGTTAPNRLRRVDRWIAATQTGPLRAGARPLAVDLGYGASPVTTFELYTRLRAVAPRLEVVGIEIEPERVAAGHALLAALREPGRPPGAYEGLSFRRGGFELPVPRPPALVRAFNVLRQYDEPAAWRAWDDLRARLAPSGVLVEGTCDEIGRRAVWATLTEDGPQTITFAAHLGSLDRPSALAERLPKTLIYRNVPGEPVHALLTAFDRCWATAAPHSAFGPRARWVEAVSLLAQTHPVLTRPPYGGRNRWRVGEVTLPWTAVDPYSR